MQKLGTVIVTISLIMLSFFYTDKTIQMLRNNDPIMKKIKAASSKVETPPVDATVDKQFITPGLKGSKIDLDDSFKKMKKYGSYNESLMVFEEVKPTLSFDNTYNKYVISGNKDKNNIALIFKVERDDNVDNILDILERNQVNATFFVDGLWLENNQEKVVYMSEVDMEIELLNYDTTYQKKYFKSALNIAQTLTSKDPKFCYTEYERKQVLNLCNSLNLHTIIPNIITDKNPYASLKDKLDNGLMISFPLGSTVEKQLPTIINYIKQRGFNLVTLENLLSEENTVN